MKSEIQVTVKFPLPPCVKRSESLEVGTAFSGQIGPHKSVFLKHYSGVVNLKNPEQTWIDDVPIIDFRQVNLEIIVTA